MEKSSVELLAKFVDLEKELEFKTEDELLELENQILSDTAVTFPHDPLLFVRIKSQDLEKVGMELKRDSETTGDFVISKWKLVTSVLSTMSISDENDLMDAISAIHPNSTPSTSFGGIPLYFKSLDTKSSFFTLVLPFITKLVLDTPNAFPNKIPLLLQNVNQTIQLSKYQCAVILANAFFCTFDIKIYKNKDDIQELPRINFSEGLWKGRDPERGVPPQEAAKISCVVNYFTRIAANMTVGNLVFERRCLNSFPDWKKSSVAVSTNVKVFIEGTIEDAVGALQVDFANKSIGGGVICGGCVQEEIRFSICPELISTMLFTTLLRDNECLIMRGAEQYSTYTGYGGKLQFGGDFQDKTSRDENGVLQCDIVAIDAIRFSSMKDQFDEEWVLRELNKAYVGFSLNEKQKNIPVATGNWGCGAFNGNKPLKTVLQMMAASVAGRDLIYYTFSDKAIAQEIEEFVNLVKEHKPTVGDLWHLIEKFDFEKHQNLFNYAKNHLKRGKCIIN